MSFYRKIGRTYVPLPGLLQGHMYVPFFGKFERHMSLSLENLKDMSMSMYYLKNL